MLKGFTQEQRKTYARAQADHHAEAAKLQRLANTLAPELRLASVTSAAADPNNKAKALAIVALRNKNFDAVQQMIQGGSLSRGLPKLKKRAKAGAR